MRSYIVVTCFPIYLTSCRAVYSSPVFLCTPYMTGSYKIDPMSYMASQKRKHLRAFERGTPRPTFPTSICAQPLYMISHMLHLAELLKRHLFSYVIPYMRILRSCIIVTCLLCKDRCLAHNVMERCLKRGKTGRICAPLIVQRVFLARPFPI